MHASWLELPTHRLKAGCNYHEHAVYLQTVVKRKMFWNLERDSGRDFLYSSGSITLCLRLAMYRLTSVAWEAGCSKESDFLFCISSD